MESKDLIRGDWRESESGRQRKYYTLTKKGVARLHADRKQWRDLVAAMKGLGLLGNCLIGGVIIGASVPIILLSRSDNANTKYRSILLGLI